MPSIDSLTSGPKKSKLVTPEAMESMAQGYRSSTLPTGLSYDIDADFSEMQGLDFAIKGGQSALEELRARRQTAGQQWFNGTLKLVGKTALGVAGALATLPTALGVGIGQLVDIGVEGDVVKWSDVYDNLFQRTLLEGSEYLDKALPNWRTSAEREMSLLRQMGTTNFWADDFFGGMSFMMSAVLGEMAMSSLTAATFGAAAPAQAAYTAGLLSRAAKLVKGTAGAAKFDDVIKAYQATGKIADAYRGMGAVRSFFTGAAYEAGVEANHFKKEAMAEMIADFESSNGRKPTDDEMQKLDKIVSSHANGVFATNLALVGTGNALVLAKTFGRPWAEVIRKRLPKASPFTKTGETIATKNITGYGKYLKAAQKAVANPFIEAFQEGAQGVTSSTALDYVMKKHSIEGADATYSLADAMHNALEEQLGSKEGRKEMLIGAIMGAIGSPIGGFQGSAIKATADALRGKDPYSDLVQRFNNNKSLPSMSAAVSAMNRQHELQEEADRRIEEGDFFEFKNAESTQMFNLLSSRYDAGYLDELKEDFAKEVDALSNEEFAAQFGYSPNMSTVEIVRRKENVKNTVGRLAKEYEKVRNIAEAANQTGAPEVTEGIAFTLFGLSNLDSREETMLSELSSKIEGLDTRSLKEIYKRNQAIKFRKAWLKTYKNKLDALKNAQEDIYTLSDAIGATRQDLRDEAANAQKIRKLESKVKEKERELADVVKQEMEARKGDIKYENIDQFKEDVEKYLEIQDGITKHYDANPADQLEIEDKLTDLVRLAKYRETLAMEFNMLSDGKNQEKFTENVKNLRQIIDDNFKATEKYYQKRLLDFAINAKDQVAELKAKLDIETDPEVRESLQNELDRIDKRFEDIKNFKPTDVPLDIPLAAQIANESTIKHGMQFTNTLFNSLGKLILSQSAIEGETVTPEEAKEEAKKQEEERSEEDPTKEQTPPPDAAITDKAVVGSSGQLNWIFNDHLKEKGVLPLEVRQAIEAFEAGNKDVKFKIRKYPIKDADRFKVTDANPDIYIERGFLVNGQIYQVDVIVNGVNVGGLLKPDRFVYLDADGVPTPLNPNIPTDAKRLNPNFTPESNMLARYIERYEGLKAFWDTVIIPNTIKDGEFTLDDVIGNYLKYKDENVEWDLNINFYSFKMKNSNKARIDGDTVEKHYTPEKFGFELPSGKKGLVVKDYADYYVLYEGETDWTKLEDTSQDYGTVFDLFKDDQKTAKFSRLLPKGNYMLITYNGKTRRINLMYPEAAQQKVSEIDNWFNKQFKKDKDGEYEILKQPLEEGEQIRDNFEESHKNFSFVVRDTTPESKGVKLKGTIFLNSTVRETKKGNKIFDVQLALKIGDRNAYITVSQNKNGKFYIKTLEPQAGKWKSHSQTIGDKLGIEEIISTLMNKNAAGRLPGKVKSPVLQSIERQTNSEISYIGLLGDIRGNYSKAFTVTIPGHHGEFGVTKFSSPALGGFVPIKGQFTFGSPQPTGEPPVAGMKFNPIKAGTNPFAEKGGTQTSTSQPKSDGSGKITFNKPGGKKGPIGGGFKRIDGDDTFGFSIVENNELFDTTEYSEARDNLVEILGESVKVEDINTVLGNIANKGISMGAFLNGIIYLRKKGLAKGTEYHEAFHMVFRTFLSNDQIAAYLTAAREKYGKPTKAELEFFRSKSSTRTNLDIKTLENLWYEEQMADGFKDYQNGIKEKNGVLAKLFRWLMDKINKWLGNVDSIDLLFKGISEGQYKYANPVHNIYTNQKSAVFSLQSRRLSTQSEEPGTYSYWLSAEDARVVSSLVAKYSTTMGFKGAVERVRQQFNYVAWFDIIKEVGEKQGSDAALRLANRINGIYSAISEKPVYLYIHEGKADLVLDEEGNGFLESNLKQIKKEAQLLESIYRVDDVTELVDEEVEDDEDGSFELFKRGADQYGGIMSLSKNMRFYIATTYGVMDYFNTGLKNLDPDLNTFPANPDHLYNGMLAALRNVEKENIFPVLLEWGKYNKSGGVFVNRLIEDITNEIGVDPRQLSFSQLAANSNIFNMVIQSFHRIEEPYIDTKVEPANEKTKFSKVAPINANVYDSDSVQLNKWAGNFYSYTGSEADFINDIENVTSILSSNSLLEDATMLESGILGIKEILDNIGIKLSPNYIKLSIVNRGIKGIKKLAETSEFHRDLLEFYDTFSHARQYELLTPSGLQQMAQTMEKVKNDPSMSMYGAFTNSEKGFASRLKRMAASNAYFDETLMKTSIQNSKGDNVYPIKLPAFDSITMKKWRTRGVEFKEAINEGRVEDARSILYEMFPHYPAYFLDEYFNNIKDNIYWQEADDVLKELIGYNLFGARPAAIDETVVQTEEGDVEFAYTDNNYRRVFGQAKDYASMDMAGKLFLKLGYFVNSGMKVKKGHRLFVPAVLEQKRTAKAFPMPVLEFSKGTTLTEKGSKAIYSRIKTEFDRIKRVHDELEQLVKEGFVPRTSIVKDYHYRIVDGKRVFQLNGKFYELSQEFEYNSDIGVQELTGYSATEIDDVANYSTVKGLKLFEFSNLDIADQLEKDAIAGKDISFEDINPAIEKFIEDEFNRFIDLLASKEVAIINKDQKVNEKGELVTKYTNNLLPAKLTAPGTMNLSLSDIQGRVNMTNLFNFFVNDFIHSAHLMSFLYGNTAMLHKDAIDVIKRNGNLISAGEELGFSKTRVAIIQDQEIDLTDPENDPLGLIAKNNKSAVHEAQNGQSYVSMEWYIGKYLRSLGKINKSVAVIIEKLRAGIPISSKEQKILKDNGSLLVDRKIVVRDLVNLFKTSAHVQSRLKTSYVANSFKRKHGKNWKSELIKLWREVDDTKDIDKLKALQAIYKPHRGYEYHHKMLENMERQGLGIISVSSASKLTSTDIGVYSNGEFFMAPFEISDENVREQVKTDSVKDEITHGTQTMGLIWSELPNDLEITTQQGMKTTLGEMKRAYIKLLADRVEMGMNLKRGELYDQTGEVNYNKLWDKLQKSLMASKIDPQLLELFRLGPDGKPLYSWNMSVLNNKLQSVYLSYASKNTLKHKVSGSKYTLVSEIGHNILFDTTTGKVISRNSREYRKNPENFESNRYDTRKLNFYRKKNDVYVCECIIPQRIADKYGVGNEIIADQEILNQLGVRIPTQDKHSMVILKPVDVLPRGYDNSIIMPSQVVFLSGADFDIDSLFAHAYDTYRKGKRYGAYYTASDPITAALRETNLFDDESAERIESDERIQELKAQIDELAADESANIDDINNLESLFGMWDKVATLEEELELREEDIKRLVALENKIKFEAKYKDQILANVEAYREGRFSDITPFSLGEINNLLLDIELNLPFNEGNKDIANTRASLTLFKDAISFFQNELGLLTEQEATGIFSAVDKAIGQHNNDVGAKGIGPAALFNIVYQKFAEYGITLPKTETEDGKIIQETFFDKYYDFTQFGSGIERINNVISTVITAMTDNAKERLAAKFNLDNNTLSPFLTMVAAGVPFQDALMIINQPVLRSFSRALASNRRTIKVRRDAKKSKASTSLEKAYEAARIEMWDEYGDKQTKADKLGMRFNADLHNYLKKALKGELDPKEMLGFQLHILDEFEKVKTANETTFYLSQVIGLIKGTKSSIHESEKIRSYLGELGYSIDITQVPIKTDQDFKVVRKKDGSYRAVVRSKGNTYYIELEQTGISPIDVSDILTKDKLVFSNIAAFATILDLDSSQIFLRTSKDYKDIFREVSSVMNKFNLRDALNNGRYQDLLITYLNMKAYRHKYGVNPDLLIPFKTVSIDNKEVPLLHFMLSKLTSPNSPYKDNPLLNFVSTKTALFNKSSRQSIAKLEGDTRSDLSPSFKRSLLDGYKQLIFDSKKVPSDIETRLETDPEGVSYSHIARYFSKKLLEYVMVMDNMQFRNRGLVKSLDPVIWQRFSKSLQEVEKLFIEGEGTFQGVFGLSKQQLIEEFEELFSRNTGRKQEMIFVSYGALIGQFKNSKVKPVKTTGNVMTGKKLQINLLEGTKGSSDQYKANMNNLLRMNMFRRAPGGLKAPRFIRGKDDKKTTIKRLTKVRTTENKSRVQYEWVDGVITRTVFNEKSKRYENPTTVDTMPNEGTFFEYSTDSDILNGHFLGFSHTVSELTKMAELTGQAGATPANKMAFNPIGEAFKGGSKSMDVWYGESNRSNPGLSNLAIRPFKFTFNGVTYDFYSVEHAYQTLKAGMFDQDTYSKYTETTDRKIVGKKGTMMQGGWNVELMEHLMRASFLSLSEEAKAAKAELLATGDATLTHKNDRGIWKTEFPRILTMLREEFKVTEDKTCNIKS